jgi:hypothetical protein
MDQLGDLDIFPGDNLHKKSEYRARMMLDNGGVGNGMNVELLATYKEKMFNEVL